MHDVDLEARLDEAWRLLEGGQQDRTAAARLACLATVGADRTPQARMVVLRRVERTSGEIDIHTDACSAKVAELRVDPQATLVIWDPDTAIQLRLLLTMAARPGTPKEWGKLPASARQVYGGAPPPGHCIAAPDDWQADPEPTRFLVLTGTLHRLEFLHLSPDRHLRAKFDRDDNWRGQWIAP